MTPLGFAQYLVDDLAASYSLLPRPGHAQLGDLVIDCAGTFITVLNLTEFDLGANCDAATLADLSVIAAHECANVSNDDGTTNWVVQDSVSRQMDLDSQMLWEWGEKHRADAVVNSGVPPTITFSISGGVASTIPTIQLALI